MSETTEIVKLAGTRKHGHRAFRRGNHLHLWVTLGYRGLFKACKSYLNLVKEYKGISYDAMNSYVTIVFSRYMMLSVAQRENGDTQTICELCFCLLDEMEDITFSQAICIIIDVLTDNVMEYFHITETQLEKFTSTFLHRLPQYMQ